MQNKLKFNIGSSQNGLDSLKYEMKTRDELIQKLRHEVLTLQEKRDQIFSEVKIYND
jgi:hypothetical protein